MATKYFLDAQGRVYSSSGAALSVVDSELVVVSTAGATAITATPTSKRMVDEAVLQAAFVAGTQHGPIKRDH